jgi:hypothetical protein
MQKTGALPIGSVLKDFLASEEHRALRERLTETAVVETLHERLGEQARYIRQASLHGRRLYIAVTSAAMRNELVMRRQQLARQINAALGERVIEEITVR